MRSAVTESHLKKCEQVFTKAWRNEDFLAANNIAMALARELFEGDAALARTIMWERFYSRLPGKGVPHQSFDFECVDYELYQIKGIKRLLRGPEPDLEHARGRYISFLGAAQLFGRHQQRPPHVLVSQALGIPCVNLAVSGAGDLARNLRHESHVRIVAALPPGAEPEQLPPDVDVALRKPTKFDEHARSEWLDRIRRVLGENTGRPGF